MTPQGQTAGRRSSSVWLYVMALHGSTLLRVEGTWKCLY